MIVEGYYRRPKGLNDSLACSAQMLDVVRIENGKLSQKYLPLDKMMFWFEAAPSSRLLLMRAVRALQMYLHVLRSAYSVLSAEERSLARLVAHDLGRSNPAKTQNEPNEALLERYWGFVLGKQYTGHIRNEVVRHMFGQYIQWATIGNPCSRDALAEEFRDFREKSGWVSYSGFQAHLEAKYPPKTWGDPRGHIYINAARRYGPQKRADVVPIRSSIGWLAAVGS